MPTQWSTHLVEFKGGLISNMSPLQQGINAQGSSTILQNMESDRQGGYTKIKGYQKFSTTAIPGTGPIKALHVVSGGRAVVSRKIDTAAVTTMQTATAQVNGATSSSTSVVLDNNSGTIEVGMYVTGDASSGLSGTVTVAAVTDQNNITLSSAQTLTDDATLSFGALSSGDIDKTAYYYGTGTNWIHLATTAQVGGNKARKVTFNFDGDDKTLFVDGLHYPGIYNASGNTMEFLSASSPKINTDVQGADLVTIFKNTAFYAKDSTILFTAPFTVDNFSAADGAGSISVGNTVTGLIVFREQLIIFTQDAVKRLIGNSSSDFSLQPITDKIGCINSDSVQEFGGDVMYLAPDGLRLLSATDRIGDFALDVASDKIYKDSDDFLNSTTEFASVILREKGQYRIFAYLSSQNREIAAGLIATKFIAQGADGIEWSTTKGIKAYICDSVYSDRLEAIMFANEDGYLYEMEQTNGFDGNDVETIMETPYMPITDPEIRKTAYKLTLYTDPQGLMDLKFNLLFNFDSGGDTRIVQPPQITIGGAAGSGIFTFGAANAVYGGSGVTFGNKVIRIYNENLIGSFHTVAMRITSNDQLPPYTLDSAVLQYRQNDRQ
jgi:hypothetical protein